MMQVQAADASPANGLQEASFMKCEQIMTISKDRLETLIGVLDSADMERVAVALCSALGIWNR